MKRLSLLLAVALIGVMAFASVAEAHKLSPKRAKQASNNATAALCNQLQEYPRCTGWATLKPERLSAHRVRVVSGTIHQANIVCVWVDIWSIRAGSRKLRYSFRTFDRTLVCDSTTLSSASALRAADEGATSERLEDAEQSVRDEVLATR